MSDGVIATNRRGQITMINSTAQRLLNLDYETATQMSILDLLDGENPYTYNELLSKTPEIHLSRRDANDEFVTLRVNFALIRKESGFISGLVAVLHDATEQEKEERERRLFVSNVSHELRTPLTLIYAPLNRMLKSLSTEDTQYLPIKAIYRQAQRMKTLLIWYSMYAKWRLGKVNCRYSRMLSINGLNMYPKISSAKVKLKTSVSAISLTHRSIL